MELGGAVVTGHEGRECEICKNHIMDTCVECQNGMINNDECKVSLGDVQPCFQHPLHHRNVFITIRKKNKVE